MENAFTSAFGKYVCHGDKIETLADEHGRFFRACLKHDDTNEAPWERSDIHGVVTNWTSIDDKRPSWRVLARNGDCARFYDVQATQKKQRDIWGLPTPNEGETQKQANARVIEDDFKVLKAWCNDKWHYFGVVISFHQLVDGEEVEFGDYLASLWGIEGNFPKSDNSYLTEEANELLEEARGSDEVKRIITETV
jgi:hypothetical protein